ncbi:MAG: zinc-dependent dehydrogenase [Candidatus Omnitrophica bacterium]|nr:zinc-dependent dehydrogenase [Candidatus Omnitrophota bacterium]HOX53977.1 zinc-dependent dehydrogenase [Candidatus Omnitrophota bacterium]
MKVAMYYNNDDVRLEETPKPEISSDEILIKVEASGICGSDVMFWYRKHKVPLVLGHEIAGEIVGVGKDVKEYKVGQRICASHHVPCGKCHYCLNGHTSVCDTLRKTNFYPGGFAEFVRLPAINVEKGVYIITDNVSYDDATFTEPLACVLRAQRLVKMSQGKSVLVMGSGISGLLHIQMAKLNKASKVIATDINDFRLKSAKQFGADEIINAKDFSVERLLKANNSRLADLIILCTGAKSAIEQALESVDRGGAILFFAATDEGVKISLDVNKIFWRNEVTLMSSYAASPEEHIEALKLISSGKINVKDMITHRFGLADTQKGFKLVAEAKNSIKVVIHPQK